MGWWVGGLVNWWIGDWRIGGLQDIGAWEVPEEPRMVPQEGPGRVPGGPGRLTKRQEKRDQERPQAGPRAPRSDLHRIGPIWKIFVSRGAQTGQELCSTDYFS